MECNRGFLDQRRLDNHLRTRFHAKRVVANKIKGAQFSKVAALKKAAVMNGLKKRGRGWFSYLADPLDFISCEECFHDSQEVNIPCYCDI